MEKLHLRILRAGDEVALKEFLVPRLDSSLFLYGNLQAAGLNDTGVRYAGTYAAAFEAGRIVAVAGHFWNQTMVLQAPVQLQALMNLAHQASGRRLGGIAGPNDQVVEAIDLLGLTAADLQMDEEEKLYSLVLGDLITPDLIASGEAAGRRIQADDLELVSQWRIGYLRELHLEDDSPELREVARRSVQEEIASGRTWILEGIAAVDLAGDILFINEAFAAMHGYTPAELRGRSFGRSAVAASLLDARSEGYQRSVLFTGISNRAAQRAYLALGYRLIGSYRITVLRKAN